MAREGQHPGTLTGNQTVDQKTLRDLFRGLQMFESYFEAYGVETLTAPSGDEWSIWDVKYLYSCRDRLSPRQAQAIELCLYENVKESEAAQRMGIQESSPVGIYANNGLRRLIAMIEDGVLINFQPRQRVLEAA